MPNPTKTTPASRTALGGRLWTILEDLEGRVPGLLGLVVSDANGLPLAMRNVDYHSPDLLSAQAVLLAHSAVGAFASLRFAGPEILVLEGSEVGLAVAPLGDSGVSLLALFNRSANVGLLKVEMERAVARVAEDLGVLGVQGGRISELFVTNQAGILIRHYSDASRSEGDADIVCGMLVAVQAFVKDALAFKSGSLEELRVGGRTLCFARGLYTIAAAVVDARNSDAVRYPLSDAVQEFEERYADVLPTWEGDPGVFERMDACFAKLLRKRFGTSSNLVGRTSDG